MSQRFPPIPLDSPSSLGSTFQSEVEKHHGHNPNFKYKDQNGAPIGLFAVLSLVSGFGSNTCQMVYLLNCGGSYTPELFHSFMAVGNAILNQQDFEPRAREIAILAVMAVYDVPFVLYAHTRIAIRLGLSKEQVAQACKGTTPTGLTEMEAIAYTAALALARTRGPLDDEIWQRAESLLGRERAARLAHVVRLYLYSSTLLNLGAINAPEE